MTMRILLPVFLVAGLAVASARSYTVSLTKPNMIGATELKPGDLKIEVNGEKAILRQGKMEAESPVKVEEGDTKFNDTTVRYVGNADGKRHIQEIRIGGTRTKLVFSSPEAVSGSR
jgi:hypothetical protein